MGERGLTNGKLRVTHPVRITLKITGLEVDDGQTQQLHPVNYHEEFGWEDL